MLNERHAKLFRNGSNQALRIPREFELPGDEVIIYQDGTRLILVPVEKKRDLRQILNGLQAIDFDSEMVDMPSQAEDIF